ncbi:MAG: response regulator [Actinomycetia bacterium]|nr:response regulator [Actinomycetes bacterium]MCH9700562.1 response regulator [Actinomycetes bacterium]MCH9760475.1 response regulator [Actinomycetes bacterium]
MLSDKEYVKPLSVLLVEDHDADIELTREAFEDARILVNMGVGRDGEEAMRLVQAVAEGKREWPDLILLDLNLPKIDGLEVLKFVKSHQTLRTIPVVILTSSRSPKDIGSAYAEYANSVISKPLDPVEFLRIVQGLKDYWVTIVRLPKYQGDLRP